MVGSFLQDNEKFNSEALAFQMMMPHFDEEFMYRGILLGLLLSALPYKIRFIGNPSIIIVSLLFALSHALTIDKSYNIDFSIGQLIAMSILGWILTWLAYKSKSLFKPIFTHFGHNVIGSLIPMIK